MIVHDPKVLRDRLERLAQGLPFAVTSRPMARMRHSPEEPPSKSYITFSEADIADDEFMTEWLLLAAESAPAKKKR